MNLGFTPIRRQRKTTRLRSASAVLAVMLAAACLPHASLDSRAASYPQTLQGLAFGKYLNAPAGYASVAQAGAWEAYLFTAPEYQCVSGGHFGLLVHPGKAADKTVLWLQPGEECWPGHPQCSQGTYPDEQALAHEVASADGSPFGPQAADRDNPLADWNYIYVPACDGSFHFGDAEADYDGDGVVDHVHHGLRQTSAAIRLMKTLFPRSQQILIAGSSTGGFGTFGATPSVRLAFPDAKLYVLNDSGPGLFGAGPPAIWPLLVKAWNLSPLLPADCADCQNQLIYLYDWLLARDPNLKIGMFSSYQDVVVSSVVGLSGAENERLLVETTGRLQQKYPQNFNRFFIKGASHCIGDYYQTVAGVSVWDWLRSLVTDDPQWRDILE